MTDDEFYDSPEYKETVEYEVKQLHAANQQLGIEICKALKLDTAYNWLHKRKLGWLPGVVFWILIGVCISLGPLINLGGK